MKIDLTFTFKERPSALYTLWKAFRNRKSKYVSGYRMPEIHAKKEGLRIDEKHLNDFYKICGISRTSSISLLYPFTLAYPYMLRILCMKEMPFSMFKVLNTRNSITMYRDMRPGEKIRIACRNSPIRIVPKGLEVNMVSEITADGEKVWDIIATYFAPGNFSEGEATYIAPRLEPVHDASITHEWYLAAKNRFRFARVSGDTNGLHYWTTYARMLGFKRDFAQPIRVVAHIVSLLPVSETGTPLTLDFFLKGPVYYENTLILRNLNREHRNRFDLYCKGNDKPCISGQLSQLDINRDNSK